MFRNVVHRTAELMDSNEEQLEQFANHLKRVIPENPPPKTVKATTKRNGRGAETNKGENSDEATKKIVKKPKKQTDDQVQEVLRRSTRSSGLLEEQLPEKQVQENRGGKTAQKSTQ